MSRSPAQPRPAPRRRPRRLCAPLALLLLGAAALLSSGFVHRQVQDRRARYQRLRARLEHTESTARLARHSRRWQSPRLRRRGRGGGWDAGATLALEEQHYVFGSDGRPVTKKLSATVVHQTLERYKSSIASCLLQHGASTVTVKLQILGSGRVSVVTTDLAGVAARCVKGVVRRVRFPAVKGGRTTGTYKLGVN